MFRSVLKTALAAVALAAVASAANAQVVSLQLQESGFPTEFIGSGTSTANFSGNFGTFFISSQYAIVQAGASGFGSIYASALVSPLEPLSGQPVRRSRYLDAVRVLQ
jgi:hypothetical protein